MTRVIFSNSSQGLIATGVEFDVDGVKYTASVSEEVILAAGTIQTPQILELSGGFASYVSNVCIF